MNSMVVGRHRTLLHAACQRAAHTSLGPVLGSQKQADSDIRNDPGIADYGRRVRIFNAERQRKTALIEKEVKRDMEESSCKSCEELSLFLNAATAEKVLSVSPSSGSALIHEPDFSVLKIGSQLVVPKEKFVGWVSRHAQGGAD